MFVRNFMAAHPTFVLHLITKLADQHCIMGPVQSNVQHTVFEYFSVDRPFNSTIKGLIWPRLTVNYILLNVTV